MHEKCHELPSQSVLLRVSLLSYMFLYILNMQVAHSPFLIYENQHKSIRSTRSTMISLQCKYNTYPLTLTDLYDTFYQAS